MTDDNQSAATTPSPAAPATTSSASASAAAATFPSIPATTASPAKSATTPSEPPTSAPSTPTAVPATTNPPPHRRRPNHQSVQDRRKDQANGGGGTNSCTSTSGVSSRIAETDGRARVRLPVRSRVRYHSQRPRRRQGLFRPSGTVKQLEYQRGGPSLRHRTQRAQAGRRVDQPTS
jgi:hypothetical protein